MKVKFSLLSILLLVILMFMASCALDAPDAADSNDTEDSGENILNDNPIFKANAFINDPQEGVDPDIRGLYVTYNYEKISIYLYFYNPVTLTGGSPFIYLYDKIDNNDRDVIIFDSPSTFVVRRDKDMNGHFETLVYSGSSVTQYNGGTAYLITVPKGVFPDIGSRKIWAYSMVSKDRIPDIGSGYLEFNQNKSISTFDLSEGINPDHSELEAGYDDMNMYFELDYHNPVSSLVWGSPYIYLDENTFLGARYMIAFKDSTTYQIRQDVDHNGHYETLVYSASTGMQLDNGKRYTFIIPYRIKFSLTNKKIWAYSMTSKDRVPDFGYLIF